MGRTSEVPVPDPGDREALRIEGLRKSFGPHEVLRGVDLDVAPHEVICLIGASGSGKSTLLRCVNLLERIDAGTIWLDGQAITRPGTARAPSSARAAELLDRFGLGEKRADYPD